MSGVMKGWLAALLVLAAMFSSARGEEPAATAAGYWEGEITLPSVKLAIRVDLKQTEGGAWNGTIGIPAQGLRGFALAGVKVDGEAVEFKMPNIPGDPLFAGKLSRDGGKISGEFSQGGQKFPFELMKKDGGAEEPLKGVPGEGLAGHWMGPLKATPLIELRLALEIKAKEDGTFEGDLISLDQGSARIPMTATVKDASEVEVAVPKIGGSFSGKFNDDGSELAGEWRQGGQKLALTLYRQAATTTLKRPQEPAKPYPYEARDVSITTPTEGVTLAGTFTVPAGAGPHPAVVLVSGSGPQDRDEAVMGHRPFLVLADHLTRAGVAVLRYDDRGFGQSTGDFGKASHVDFTNDALAALDWLKSQPEVDAKRIGVVGHSEGGIVAPLVASQRPDEIAFIVLLAGVGVPMDQLLVRQGADLGRAMGQSEEEIAKQSAKQREMMQLVKSDVDDAELEKRVRETVDEQLAKLTPEQRKTAGVTDTFASTQAKLATTPWFRQLIAYDPAPALQKVRCPVLAINGEKDLQVAADENLAGIRAALEAGGNKEVTTRKLAQLNHLFQHCESGTVAEYGQIEETFAPEALEVVTEWIGERVGK